MQAAVQICVVGHYHAPRVEMSPRMLQLEEEVAPGVPAVMNEEIDAFEPTEEGS
jgi:hypothetical protein